MTTGAKRRKSQPIQTKQVSNQTTSKIIGTTVVSDSLKENLKHLRSLLSVDLIIDDFNQEEALEFLEAVEGGIAFEREEHKDEMDELKTGLDDKFKEKDEEIEELKHDYDELMKKTDFDLQIGTIEYRAPGIMDDMIMEALAEAYDRLTPLEIIERIKVTSLKKAI